MLGLAEGGLVTDEITRRRNAVLDIEGGAPQIRAAAAELTKRIKLFEDWLSRLPGRVEASYELWSSENGNESQHLSLRREGKEWTLRVDFRDEDREASWGETLLRDAPVTTKICAMRRFPDLLDAILAKQGDLIKQANEVATEFDEFARTLAIKEGK